jgi:tRNA U55 pseudouridine synthase TruB
MLGCGAHLSELKRTRSGKFSIDECMKDSLIEDEAFNVVGAITP